MNCASTRNCVRIRISRLARKFAWKRLAVCALCVVLCVRGSSSYSDEPAEPSSDEARKSEARKKEREENLKIMEERARKIKVVPADAKPDDVVELIAQPLFHYTDQPRRILDATLWGWRSQGRLLAVCKIERYEDKLRPEGPFLYCFGATSLGLISAQWPDGRRWSAQQPGLKLLPVESGPPAAEGKAARLRQMKELAQRFEATMIEAPQNMPERRQEMRLLPQPIYRYETSSDELRDGAAFGLTSNGTNPDAILVIELHEAQAPRTGWNFGVAGMTTSQLSVRHNGKEVWTKPTTPGVGSYPTWTWFWEGQQR